MTGRQHKQQSGNCGPTSRALIVIATPEPSNDQNLWMALGLVT